MERRDFIKKACGVCALASTGMLLGAIQACKLPQNIVKLQAQQGVLQVDESRFETSDLLILRTNDWDYDIALRKMPDGLFLALSMKCTHYDETLSQTGNGFVCDLHGSLFDTNGNVLKGPAKRPLRTLKTSIENKVIKVSLS